MRVVLVGSPEERARLRQQMNGTATVAAEFDTLAAARAARLDADAIVVANHAVNQKSAIRPPTGSGRPELVEGRDPHFEESLTPREVEVLELLAEGLPNKAIAARLGISDQTVKFHVAAISGKLGAANRTDAVRLAVRRGLITL